MRLRFDDWVFDSESREVRRRDVPVHLTPKAFELLGALLEARPRALSKAEIHDRLWPQTFVSEATLASVVSELRAALGDDPKSPRFVRTVHGHGYAFSGAAAEDPPGADAPRPARGYAALALGLAAAIALFAVIAVTQRARLGRLSDAGGPRSLAVLPLANLSNDPEQEYFTDGLTEGLITSLSRVNGLQVVSRTSVMRFKGAMRPRAEIARELGADLLIEGSALRTGNRIRLTARLVDPGPDRQLWTETYERALKDTAGLPDAIARDVAAAARLALTPEQQARLASVRPVDPDAYDAYLKGRYQFVRGSSESTRRSIEHFQEALGRDPRYAPAYAGLASAYNFLATVFSGQPPREMRALAAAAAQKALAIDPDLADAHRYLGDAMLYDWDFAGAEREFRRAIELDPGSGAAHSGYSAYLISQDRMDEAVAEARKGKDLDPLSVRARRTVGYTLFQARRYDEAIASLQGVVAADPKDAFSRWFLGMSYSWRGRHGEAVAELEQAVALSNRSPVVRGSLAAAHARAGRTAEARTLLAELREVSRRRYVSPVPFVFMSMALGDHEEALRSLERGFDERINYMIFLNRHEWLDPLRSDPRFRDLVRRIGLPEK